MCRSVQMLTIIGPQSALVPTREKIIKALTQSLDCSTQMLTVEISGYLFFFSVKLIAGIGAKALHVQTNLNVVACLASRIGFGMS